MKLYHTKVAPSAFAATTEAAGYPATNLGLEDVDRPWRAASAAANDVTLTFAGNPTVAAIVVSEVNCAAIAVQVDVGAGYVAAGNLLTYADKDFGRRRGILVLNRANVVRIKLTFAGAPTLEPDGKALGYWKCGAVYALASSVAIPRNPDIGMNVRAILGVQAQELANKRTAKCVVGVDRWAIAFTWDRRYDQDVLEIARRARYGTVVLDFEYPNFPELVVPLENVADQVSSTHHQLNRMKATLELREVA